MRKLSPSLAGAICAAGAALFNAAGVVPLKDVPGAYKPDTVVLWLESLRAAPGPSELSAALFVAGVLLLVPTAAVLARRLDAPAPAAALAAGAVLNAAGALLPIVVTRYVPDGADAVGQAFLGTAIALDAAFNACLGAAMLGFGVAARRAGASAYGWAGIVAGLATLPVAGQIVSRGAADWLGVAGPLWLTWLLWTAVRIARSGVASRA